MEFLQINSPEDYRVEKIYRSYCSTFLEDERRDWDKLATLFTNPAVQILSVLYETENVGYLIVWELSRFHFIEHFEVFPEFRSRNVGSRITGSLAALYPRLILEIEPEHVGEDAKRRYFFYQKNGFRLVDEMYVQPSYGKDKKPLNLWLLANHTPEDLQAAKDEIYDIVYH